MAEESEAALRKWLKDTDLNAHLGDKEVRILLTSLKERIDTLKASPPAAPTAAGGSSPAAVVNEQDIDLSNCTRIKVVVVGDGAVGKTSLLISYATDKFPENYVPTVFENYSTQITRPDGTHILLHLWDTAGQEDYDRLRPLSYPGADVVMLAFSTVNNASFGAIREKWFPEVHHYVPKCPLILVGTKVDCRESKVVDPNLGRFDPVTTEMGKALAAEIGAALYTEISSKTRFGLNELFQSAIDLVVNKGAPSGKAKKAASSGGKKSCLLL